MKISLFRTFHQREPDIAGVAATFTKSSKRRLVLLTCRQILNEALPIYYRETKFLFKNMSSVYMSLVNMASHNPMDTLFMTARLEQMAYFHTRPFLQKVERAMVSLRGVSAQLTDILPKLREVWIGDIELDGATASIDMAESMSFEELWLIYKRQPAYRKGYIAELVARCPDVVAKGKVMSAKRTSSSTYFKVCIHAFCRCSKKLTTYR